MKKAVSILLILSFLFPLLGQSSSDDEEAVVDLTPVPYTDQEFPRWTKDLRRAEIIFFGSTPFTFLFSALGYRTAKYGWDYFSAENVDDIDGWNDLEQQDQINMIYIGLGLSLSIAVTDFIIGRIEDRKDAE